MLARCNRMYNMLHVYLDNLMLQALVNSRIIRSNSPLILLRTMCTACTNSYKHECLRIELRTVITPSVIICLEIEFHVVHICVLLMCTSSPRIGLRLMSRYTAFTL